MQNKPNLITKRVQSDVPRETQMRMWNLMERLSEKMPLDYLQVFELHVEDEHTPLLQTIIHRQEQPFYESAHRFFVSRAMEAKLFVVDDGEHYVMMLATEY